MTPTWCPSCGYAGDDSSSMLQPTFPASSTCYGAYLDLAVYNAERARPDFLHQEAVDAYAAQHPGPPTKPITVWFALVGLHLFVDRGLTGRQVQDAHMRLARFDTTWKAIEIPSTPTGMTVGDVVEQAPGDHRDAALVAWAEWVWSRWKDHHDEIAALCEARAL